MVDQGTGEIQDVSVSGLADAMTTSSEITANTSSGMDLPRTVAEPSGLSVEWADSVDDRSMDEAVLHILRLVLLRCWPAARLNRATARGRRLLYW